jgi:hypothetical protein
MPRPLKSGFALLAIVVATACAPAFWQGVSEGLASTAPAATTKLMIFGGQGHKTYLGCLSCSQFDTESIFNEYGTYGSAYSAQSVRNAYSQFGSQYSATSACNPYASDPPVIVDGNGRYYGRLTVNVSRSDAPRSQELRAWLAAVCEH